MRDFHLPGRSAVYATGGMVATSHPLASAAALRVLTEGGSAVDAALAAAVLSGVAEPQMCGLGGDLFALVHVPGQPVAGLNASGRAPADPGTRREVTVPGAVAGIAALHGRFGRLDLARVLAPAIDAFEGGVPVAPRVAFDWQTAGLTGAAARHFGAAPRRPGVLLRLPGQAEVLRRIAAGGADGFYRGSVAEDMVASLAAAGGRHSLEDFAEAAADWVTPVPGDYRGRTLIELPPNGTGVTAHLIAQVLSRFDLPSDPLGAARAHLEAEIAARAMAAHGAMLGEGVDPAAALAPAVVDRIAASVDPERATPVPPEIGTPHKETICLSVVDRDGMAVSLIYSIFADFGSGLASDRYGILFHNRGASFRDDPGHPNGFAPGRRPVHTIIPAMLYDGDRLEMAFGVMGGRYQPTGHVRLLSNLLDYGMDLQAAIDAPRSGLEDGLLKLEDGYPAEVAEALAVMGHRIGRRRVPFGGAQAVRVRPDGVLEGGSDPRKDGCALGL